MKRHFMDDRLDQYRKIRKPVAKPGKVMTSKKDSSCSQKWDWRQELEETEDDV